MSELGEKHQDKIKVENLDATTAEYKGLQAGLGFKSHGLLIRDEAGKIVFKQADHTVKEDEVKAFVEEYLE